MARTSAPEFRGEQFSVKYAPLRIAIPAAAVLFALSSGTHAAELKPSDETAKPEFSLPDMNGTTVSLRAFKGRIVLVHFFATWCEPCREELPALTRFQDRTAGHASVVSIAVADADPRVRRFFEHTPVSFPVLLDRDRAIAKSWKVSVLPSTYILDADMKPVLMADADFPWDEINIDPATGGLIAKSPEALKNTSAKEKD